MFHQIARIRTYGEKIPNQYDTIKIFNRNETELYNIILLNIY